MSQNQLEPATSIKVQASGLVSVCGCSSPARPDIDVWEPYRLSFFGEYIKTLHGTKMTLAPSQEQSWCQSGARADRQLKVVIRFGCSRLNSNPNLKRRAIGLLGSSIVTSSQAAMPDAFTDNDFGGAAQTLRFGLGAHVALTQRSSSVRIWMSNSIKSLWPAIEDRHRWCRTSPQNF